MAWGGAGAAHCPSWHTAFPSPPPPPPPPPALNTRPPPMGVQDSHPPPSRGATHRGSSAVSSCASAARGLPRTTSSATRLTACPSHPSLPPRPSATGCTQALAALDTSISQPCSRSNTANTCSAFCCGSSTAGGEWEVAGGGGGAVWVRVEGQRAKGSWWLKETSSLCNLAGSHGDRAILHPSAPCRVSSLTPGC